MYYKKKNFSEIISSAIIKVGYLPRKGGGYMYDIIVQILAGLFVGIILLFIEYFYFLNDKNNKKK